MKTEIKVSLSALALGFITLWIANDVYPSTVTHLDEANHNAQYNKTIESCVQDDEARLMEECIFEEVE